MSGGSMTREATRPLQGVAHLMFDLDGCLWFGEQLAPGAAELVRDLRAAGLRVAFLTNASVASASGLAEKLARLGIPAREEEVVAPLDVLADHGAFRTARRALVLGGPPVRACLEGRGIEVAERAEGAEVVVVGKDAGLTYGQLAEATHALASGARLLALNLDASVPGEGGRRSPGVGAIAAALSTASGVTPELVGKPSELFFRHALAQFGMPPDTTAMVGDTPATDVRGGRAVGVRTVLVGPAPRGARVSDPREQADLQVTDLAALRAHLPLHGS